MIYYGYLYNEKRVDPLQEGTGVKGMVDIRVERRGETPC